MNQSLLSILVCPVCQSGLVYDKQNEVLICKIDKLAYPIVDGVPRMLIDQAQNISLDELKQYD